MHGYVLAVCDELDTRHPESTTATEVRQGFQQFMTVLTSIQAKQANERSVK